MGLSKNDILQLLSLVPDLKQIIAQDPHQSSMGYHYLSDGITNENYRITLAGKDYVLRINNPDSGRLALDREAENSVMQRVSCLHMASETLFYSPEHNFRVNRWKKGVTWTKKSFHLTDNLKRLAARLKQLHCLPYNNLPVMDLIKRLDHYREMIQQRHGKLPPVELKLLSVAVELVGNIKHSLDNCLCHNDLTAANILASNEQTNHLISFLDWEYAAVNDPLFELAVVCKGNELSEQNQQYLLKAYLGEERLEQYKNTFVTWCWFYQYISLLWEQVILPANRPLSSELECRFQLLLELTP